MACENIIDVLARKGGRWTMHVDDPKVEMTVDGAPLVYGTTSDGAISDTGAFSQYGHAKRLAQVRLLKNYTRTPPSPYWPSPAGNVYTAGSVIQVPISEAAALVFHDAAVYA